MKKNIFVIATLLLFNSCIKENYKMTYAIEGWWTIDTIHFKKKYDIRTCLGENSLFFHFDKKSNFPVAGDKCGDVVTGSFDNSGEITLVTSSLKRDTIPFRLIINTKNQLFSGVYKIVFDKDSVNHLLKMELMSDDLYIVCRKGLFNFDENVDLVNELEKLTWTNRPKE
ncbi:MAG: hypothetical protein ABIN13_14190 [Mucilaginibacter sp.]